jgi:hypothetical protein
MPKVDDELGEPGVEIVMNGIDRGEKNFLSITNQSLCKATILSLIEISMGFQALRRVIRRLLIVRKLREKAGEVCSRLAQLAVDIVNIVVSHLGWISDGDTQLGVRLYVAGIAGRFPEIHLRSEV